MGVVHLWIRPPDGCIVSPPISHCWPSRHSHIFTQFFGGWKMNTDGSQLEWGSLMHFFRHSSRFPRKIAPENPSSRRVRRCRRPVWPLLILLPRAAENCGKTLVVSPPPIRQKIKVGSCYLGHFPTSFRRGGGQKTFFFLSPSYQYSGDKKSCIFRSPAGTLRLFFIILPSYLGGRGSSPRILFLSRAPRFPPSPPGFS